MERVNQNLEFRFDRKRDGIGAGDYSAATICCVRHCPSKARSEAGFTGLFSTAIFSSRAAVCTAGCGRR